MRLTHDDVKTLSYPERQLIVVEDDNAVDVLQRATSATEDTARRARGVLPAAFSDTPVVSAVAAGVVSLARPAVYGIAIQLWKAWKRADRAHLPFLILTRRQASTLTFPNGHPLRKVVYVGDPGLPHKYYPISSFHRVLFEGKVAEALRLLRTLGATEISIEYVEGFERGAGVDLSHMNGPHDVGLHTDGQKKANSGAKTTMTLSPTRAPQVPDDLIWFRSEPLWQEVANARLESGLRAFTIDVNYRDDFGINARLQGKISNVGLQLGGNFTEYRETRWRLSGEFAAQPPTGSVNP